MLGKTLGVVHHAGAAANVAEDEDGDGAGAMAREPAEDGEDGEREKEEDEGHGGVFVIRDHVLLSLPLCCCKFPPPARQNASQGNPALFRNLHRSSPRPKLARLGHLDPPLASARPHRCAIAYSWYVARHSSHGIQTHSSQSEPCSSRRKQHRMRILLNSFRGQTSWATVPQSF